MRSSYRIAAILFSLSQQNLAHAIELESPVVCQIGKDCWIQQYADHETAGTAKDYRCNGETYFGHDGTDFRALNVKSDITVVAAAPGIVRAIRDGVADRLANTPELLRASLKQECGNGVVVLHKDGYETQYCHMRKGSVLVKAGDPVAAGTPLGKIGYSGAAAFAHLHFSLRQKATKLDPFSGPLMASCGVNSTNYWSQAANKLLEYHNTELLELGWSKQKLNIEDLELGTASTGQPAASWPEILAYMRAINLKAGDEISLEIVGPAGQLAQNSQKLDHDKAEFTLFAGNKSHGENWPVGTYRAHLKVMRAGKIEIDQSNETILK